MNSLGESLVLLTALSLACATGCSRAPQDADQETSPPPQAAELSRPAPTEKPEVYDGPFGLVGGMALVEMKRLVPDLAHEEGNFYTAKVLPTPHTYFEHYRLQVSETVGLCRITAFGKNISARPTGFELRNAFKDIADGLTAKYGKGKTYDFTTRLTDDGNYWMLTLSTQERTFSTTWQNKLGSTLPAGISTIDLEAQGLNWRTGFLILKYEFPNLGDCVAEQAGVLNKAL